MSRSGYSDDVENWSLIRWRGQVASATRGKRGQAFLKELLEALDDMAEKSLIANSFSAEGGYCTLGVIGAKRGVPIPSADDYDEYEGGELAIHAGATLGIARQLAAEIMFYNDEAGWHDETPKERWLRMRDWVAKQIQEAG